MQEQATDVKQADAVDSKSSFDGIVLVKKVSKTGNGYYSVLYKGKSITIGDKKLVGFDSKRTAGNITIPLVDDSNGSGSMEFASVLKSMQAS